MEVTVRELKSRLSEYLRRAEAGEEILVLSRKRPVARLVPVLKRTHKVRSVNDIRKQLEGVSGVRWGQGKPEGGRGVALHGGGKTATDIVLEDRE